MTTVSENRNRSVKDLTFVSTTGENPDFVHLCSELDQALDELVGKKFQRSAYDQFNTRESIHDVIIAYDGKMPVACGRPLMAACHLYQKIGYKIIKNYGQYADMENSICMQKEI